MKLFCKLAVLALISANVSASKLEIGIAELLEPTNSSESFLVFGTDGRIFELEQNRTEDIELVKQAMKEKLNITVDLGELAQLEDTLDTRNIIESVKLTSNEKENFSQEASFENKDRVYGNNALLNDYITDFSSYNDANYYFNRMRTDTRGKSQCYNRAHVWAWELYQNSYQGSRIQVGKIWLFFSRAYVRNYRYKWWFHIAPTVYVEKRLNVLDRKFATGPVFVKQWTDIFVHSSKTCVEVTRYSDYRRYNQDPSQDCIIMNTSVHYWQPFQIENLETRNQSQNSWAEYEVRKAYRNAIGWFARPVGMN